MSRNKRRVDVGGWRLEEGVEGGGGKTAVRL